MTHTSVLLNESINGLNLKAGGVFVDATLNAGGHSKLVLDNFGKNIRIIGIDVDADAIERAKQNISAGNASFFQENFRKKLGTKDLKILAMWTLNSINEI